MVSKLTPTIEVRGFSLRSEQSERETIDPLIDSSSPDFRDCLQRKPPRQQYYLPHRRFSMTLLEAIAATAAVFIGYYTLAYFVIVVVLKQGKQ